MKKLFLLSLLVITATMAVSAQQIRFYNASFSVPATEEKTSNVRFYYLDAQPATVKDYKHDSVLHMIASVYGVDSPNEADKLIRYYTRRGFLYYQNPELYRQRIQLIRFRDNGKPLHKLTGKNHKVYYEQIWNEEGAEILRNGSGYYTYFDSIQSETFTEIYLDSLLVEKYSIRQSQQDTLHHHFDKPAEPRRSKKDFYQSLNRKLNQRELAKLAQEDGSVLIRFIVAKDGRLTDFQLIPHDGRELSPQMLRELSKLAPWKPAIFQGKPVNSVFVQPIRVNQ